LAVGWVTEVQFLTGAKEFSPSLQFQTGCGIHTAFCQVGEYQGCFPWGKDEVAGALTNQSPPSTAEVKEEQRYMPTIPYVCMMVCNKVSGTVLLIPDLVFIMLYN
jgi:hypothetical protein